MAAMLRIANFWFRSYNEVIACLIGARRGHPEPVAVGIEVIATVEVSKESLRSASCELHRVLLAGCSSG
jgi:hypothetical protein